MAEFELWLEFNGDEEGEETCFLEIEDSEKNLDDLVGFTVETYCCELNKILDSAIEKLLFSNAGIDHITLKLSDLSDYIEGLSDDQIMGVIAYNEEYPIGTIDELIDIDFDNIDIIAHCESVAEYVEELTIENNPELQSLSQFVDWSGYADYAGYNFQVTTFDNKKFIYQLT